MPVYIFLYTDFSFWYFMFNVPIVPILIHIIPSTFNFTTQFPPTSILVKIIRIYIYYCNNSIIVIFISWQFKRVKILILWEISPTRSQVMFPSVSLFFLSVSFGTSYLIFLWVWIWLFLCWLFLVCYESCHCAYFLYSLRMW